jgi:type IX secretion system PorP/SprF family membrane protein
MKKYIIIAFLAVASMQLSAQQIPSTSQYYFNHYTMNPAATGTSDFLPLAFSYRKMWTGIDQSPSVIYFSGEMSVAKSMGAGVKFYNYSAGPLRKTGAELTYSYHIEFSPEMHLAFGLSGMFYQFHLAKSDLSFEDPNDPIQMSGEEQMIVPDVSFGTYFYGDNYFVGLSVPHLVNRNIDLKSDNILQEKQVRHYYLFGGYDFEVNPDLKIKSSALIKFIEAGLFQVDINALVEYRESFLGGISFRSSDALVFQLGFKYDDIFVGYAYDLAIGSMRGNTFGSHEVFLRYNLPNFIRRGRY